MLLLLIIIKASTEELGLAVEKLVKLSGKRNFLAIPSYKIILESFSQVRKMKLNQKMNGIFYVYTF